MRGPYIKGTIFFIIKGGTMREVFVKYNPFIVSTEVEIDGVKVTDTPEFENMREGIRLQEWVEPSGSWKGFYKELALYLNGEKEITINFKGTDMDYADLQYAGKKYAGEFDRIDYTQADSGEQIDRISEISRKYQELLEGPYDELKDEKIKASFKKAVSKDFEILVVAPMSSGKSTLINAIIGNDILPAVNTATTATIAKIKNCTGEKEFHVTCTDKSGNVLADHEKATLELLNSLNDKAKDIDCINVEGEISNIASKKLNIVFVDTPGGNNSQDAQHMEIMKEALEDENKGMILYVFNFTQLETGDCDQILSMVAQAIEHSASEKLARDRFIFVCNKMDAQNLEKEPYDMIIEKIKKNLLEKGITDPNLFLTCADACKLIRMKKSGVQMGDSDDDRLHGYLRPFNRDSRQLFKYATIPDDVKQKYSEQVEELSAAGDKENLDVAEINSGIPALEYAVSTYIEKYAVAIKIKNVHDVFMRRVSELEMIGKSKERWAKSQEEYKNMREELAKKISVYEKDQQLKKFKDKIDDIKTDYSEVTALKESYIAYIRDLTYSYPDNVKKAEAGELLKNFHDKVVESGNKLQEEFSDILEKNLYGQCKEVLGEYKAYIDELDRKGLLNIGDYNFRKIQGFDQLNVTELSEDTISDEYVHTEVVDALKIKKPGFLNAIKRLIANIDGWDIVSVKEDFVSMQKYLQEIIGVLENELLTEFDVEINRAKENERKVKDFVMAELSDIDKKVKIELVKIKNATEDKKELEKRVANDKYNMEWLTAFVDDMNRILDV